MLPKIGALFDSEGSILSPYSYLRWKISLIPQKRPIQPQGTQVHKQTDWWEVV